MKQTTNQIKSILENETISSRLKNLANANPNLEVQELSLADAEKIYEDVRNTLLDSIEKDILDELSFNTRNAIHSHLHNIQRFANDPNRFIPQINAVQHQIEIAGIRKLTFDSINLDNELKELTSLRRRYSKLLKDINDAEGTRKDLLKIDNSIKKLVKSIEETKVESDNYNKTLASIKTEIESSKTAIIKSEQDIKNKKEDVLEFSQYIDESKESLESIEEELKNSINELIITKSEQAQKLIEQAEKALELKSTEGISAAYSSRLDKLSKEKFKQNWLYGAIGFVILTFITGYLLTGGQITISKLNIGFTATDNVAFIIGRILLTAIGISGAAFCANRFVTIRNLEEDYEYKVVLSKSILAFANKIKELDKTKTADYLNKVLTDLLQDPLRERKSKNQKEADMELVDKITNVIKKIKGISDE